MSEMLAAKQVISALQESKIVFFFALICLFIYLFIYET
jgi:hypothetical protein